MDCDSKKWYIDRSRNLTEENKDFIIYAIHTVNELSLFHPGEKIDSTKLISFFPDKIKNGANPFSILTFLRDIGVIDLENKIGQNAFFVANRMITYNEYIFELLIKRGYGKPNTEKVKPLVVVMMTMLQLFQSTSNPMDVYLTFDECSSFLFQVTSYGQINQHLISCILNGRKKENTISAKNYGVLDILFNVWKMTPFFFSGNEKNKLVGNMDQIDFYRFVSNFCPKMSDAPMYNPSLSSNKNNQCVYEYLGNSENGIIEVIPKVEVCKNIQVLSKDIPYLHDYLFGISFEPSFNYKKYFSNAYFGVYKAFVSLRGLALRNIYFQERRLGEALLKYYTYGRIDSAKSEKISLEVEAKIQVDDGTIDAGSQSQYLDRMFSLRNREFLKKFETGVFNCFQNKCAVCGLEVNSLLSAYHIKPFSRCENVLEAIDEDNGILLCPLHGTLFEKGFLCVDENGIFHISNLLKNGPKEIVDADGRCLEEGTFTERRRNFLNFHKNYIFIKKE